MLCVVCGVWCVFVFGWRCDVLEWSGEIEQVTIFLCIYFFFFSCRYSACLVLVTDYMYRADIFAPNHC